MDGTYVDKSVRVGQMEGENSTRLAIEDVLMSYKLIGPTFAHILLLHSRQRGRRAQLRRNAVV